jgi:hypothetical protein
MSATVGPDKCHQGVRLLYGSRRSAGDSDLAAAGPAEVVRVLPPLDCADGPVRSPVATTGHPCVWVGVRTDRS